MNKYVKLLAVILVLLVVGRTPIALAEPMQESSVPGNLKVNMLSQAYGIPVSNPSFSWVMSSSLQNQLQTAYQIEIASSLQKLNADNADVFNTGEVASRESSAVHINGLSLSQNTLYYWRVRVWSSDGAVSAYSAPSAMTTEVGQQWADNDAIWAGTSDYYTDGGWDNYVVELNMKITSTAAGICFRETKESNFYMWQFNATNNTLDPYTCKNGAYTQLDTVDLSQSGVKIQENAEFHVKIEANGNSITTYINGTVVDQRTVQTYSFGTVGFRNGASESAVFRNVQIYKTNDAGAIEKYLYSDQFVYGSNPFSGGALLDNALVVGKSQNIALSAVSADGDWGNVAINMDMEITSNAAGIAFRVTDGSSSYYLWQFSAQTNTFSPQVCMNGNFIKIADIDLASSGIKLVTGQFYRVQIITQGDTVITCINGTQVDARAVSYLSSGTIGFRTGMSEEGVFRNISVNSLDSAASSAPVLYKDAFLTGANSFSGGSLSGGELRVGSGSMLSLMPPEQDGDFTFLRDEFQIDDTSNIDKAIISVTATSSKETKQYIYNLYLNGTFVGAGPNTSIQGETRYNSYDVTSLLKNGVNAVGTLNYALSGKQFLLQMTVYYRDGTSKILLNSRRDAGNFRALDGTAVFGESGSVGTTYYTQAAENINAALYPDGWDSPGFDDSAWSPVKLAGSIASGNLQPSTASNVGRYESSASSVVNKGGGNYFIDLGKEVVGGLSLTVTSPAADQITLTYGEEKSGNSGVKYEMRTGNCYQEKWTLKAGTQTIQNFGLKTFRYVEIQHCPVPITAKNVSSVSVRQDFDDSAADFTSSNSDLNTIYDVSKYTVKETNQELQVDSQSRERTAYQGDEFVDMLSNFAVDPDTTLTQYTTEYLNYHDTWPAEYKLMSVLLTWTDYMYTGDLSMVSKYYSVLQRDKLFDSMFDPTYQLIKSPSTQNSAQNSVMVDWPASEQDGYDTKDAVYNTVLNAVAFKAYQDMASMAQLLGNYTDAQNYSDRASDIQNAMMSALYNSTLGAFSDGLTANGTRIEHYAQHASAYALAFGVVSDTSDQSAVAAYLGKDGTFKTSVYGALFVLSGLYQANAGDTAMKLLTGTGQSSWNHMIKDLGATITAEAWDPSLKSNMSFSHAWGSAPASQIESGLFGIEPLTAGFSTFQVKFQPGGLQYASVKVPTVKGTITAQFDTSAGVLSASVGIPYNTTATVYVPTQDSAASTLVIDGNTIACQRSGTYLVVQLGSGQHTISPA